MYSQLVFKDFQANFKRMDGLLLNHKHNTYELFLLTEGEADVCVGRRRYPLNPGYLFLMPPNMEHKYVSEQICAGYEISFSRKFLELFFTKDMIKRLTRCFAAEVLCPSKDEVKLFAAIYDKMLAQKKCGGDYPVQLALLLDMLNESSITAGGIPVKQKDDKKEITALEDVIAYMNAHYREIRSMEEIVSACFISKSYLCSAFKEHYKMTVMEYLRKLRIRHACEFLATSDKPLSLIAQKMGFSDLSHFTRVFKKEMGMSPNEYRIRQKIKRYESKPQRDD